MKRSLTLTQKILLLALINVIFTSLVLATIIGLRFKGTMSSLMIDPIRDRLTVVTRELVQGFQDIELNERGATFERLRKEAAFDFYLFEIENQKQLAGPPITLPPEILAELRRRPPSGRFPVAVRPQFPPEFAGPMGPGGPVYIRSESSPPYWILVRTPIRSKGAPTATPAALVLSFPSIWKSPVSGQLITWAAVVITACFISVICWFPLLRRLTQLIDRMNAATGRIADGHFDVELGINRDDEVGRLATSITRMASRLETFVKGQKRFLGDIAHELRSPLGRMRVAAELIARDSANPDGKYFVSLHRELNLMSEVTDQLITLARTELVPAKPELRITSIEEVVHRAIEVEGEGKFDIRVQLDPGLEVIANPEGLFRSVSNLLRNSIRYAGTAGPIEIKAARHGRHVVIMVADCGPGVPADALEKIFEPFYRVDTSRDRRTGGTGLGLAIVRSCMEDCQGSVECRNREPRGLVVTLKLEVPS